MSTTGPRPPADNPGHPSRFAGRGDAPPWNLSEVWNIPDDGPDEPGDQARPFATLVSFHYLRAAVRRRRRVCAAFALVGLLLAVGYLLTNPAMRTATTTLRLTHSAEADPAGAIATDMSLVKTRTVAERTIHALRLTISPNELMSSVDAVATGSTEILELTMTASTDAEAVRRLDEFTTQYLAFRATQISAQSTVLIKGYEAQIEQLKSQAKALHRHIDRLANGGPAVADQLSQAVTKLSQINDKIGALQGTVEDQTLQQQAIVSASGVIDPAAPAKPAGLRRIVLVLASGLIGGLAIGLVVIVLRAILSDRLWLRIEVAAALNAPVLSSARRVTPLPRLLRFVLWLPWLRAEHARRAVDRQRMAHTIDRTVPEAGPRQCLAVVCLNNSDELRFSVVAAALDMQSQGRMATIVDLTDAGTVASVVAQTAGVPTDGRPAVFRPNVVPSLTEGPTRVDAAAWEDPALANGKNRVTLVLADLDPAIGLDHLTGWTDSVIVAVTAGESSVELVRTTGDLVRSVGLKLRGAVLLRAAADDMSSGAAATDGEAAGERSAKAVAQQESSVGRSS